VLDITSRYPDWNSPEEKERVLQKLRDAKQIFEAMR